MGVVPPQEILDRIVECVAGMTDDASEANNLFDDLVQHIRYTGEEPDWTGAGDIKEQVRSALANDWPKGAAEAP
jgi:hypothetical protein